MSSFKAQEFLPLYSAKESRELDSIIISKHVLSGALLMQRAGFGVFQRISDTARSIMIFSGRGNNGGDGFVVAALAKQENLTVVVVLMSNKNKYVGDAKIMLEYAEALGVDFEMYSKDHVIPNSVDVVIDAIFGTGLSRDVTGDFYHAIESINKSNAHVISVDIPSGISADTGGIFGNAVKADMTVTFIGYKKGLMTGDALDYCGQLELDKLSIPKEAYYSVKPQSYLLNIDSVKALMHHRTQNSHKGMNGHLVVIAGDEGMSGAAVMNSMSALKIGAGKVTLLTHPNHASFFSVMHPEIICYGADTDELEKFDSLMKTATAILIGSGMSIQKIWSHRILKYAFKQSKPIIADAAALDYLHKCESKPLKLILTPHQGEASRILNIPSNEVNMNRYLSVQVLSKKYNAVSVLKGSGTLICDKNGIVYVCPYGNPSMSTAGTGDVLAGMIAGLVAQGHSEINSAIIGTILHSYIADILAEKHGELGFVASDLYNLIQVSR